MKMCVKIGATYIFTTSNIPYIIGEAELCCEHISRKKMSLKIQQEADAEPLYLFMLSSSVEGGKKEKGEREKKDEEQPNGNS